MDYHNKICNLMKDKTITGCKENYQYGWGNWNPQNIQRFHSPHWLLICLSWAAIVQGMFVNGFLPTSISTIEKHFDLSSTKTGIIAAMYDVAVVLVIIIVCYFGGKGHKGRWLGYGTLLISLGAVLYALPHFISEPNFNTSSVLDKSDTICNQGIYLSLALIGPAIGFILGGIFLNIPGNFGNLNITSFDSDHPNWYGAWWIGFILSSILGFLIVIPILGFAKHLPGFYERRASDLSGNYDSSNDVCRPNFENNLSFVIKLLFKNPTLVCTCLADSMENCLVGGFISFIPKFVENQFNVNSGDASFYTGGVVVLAGGLGVFFGGYFIKKFQLECLGIIKFAVLNLILSSIFATTFFVDCPNTAFAGVTMSYKNSSLTFMKPELLNECNVNCSCLDKEFNPVCGSDNVLYFSPCHAGCYEEITHKNSRKVYSNCSCILIQFNSSDDHVHSGIAYTGKCVSTCKLMPLFLILFFILVFCTFMASVPTQTVILRCVPFSQRPMASALQWIMVRCLGSIPGPIIFGAIIDYSCLLWREECGQVTSCIQYDNPKLSQYIFYLGVSIKIFAISILCVAYKTYQVPALNQTSQTHLVETPSGEKFQEIQPNNTTTIKASGSFKNHIVH